MQLNRDQVAAVLRELDWSDVADDVQADIESATLAGANDALLGGDIDDAAVINTANDAAREYAEQRAAELVGSGKQSISETTRENLRSVISQSFEDETGLADLLAAIENAGIFSESRAMMIARTEVNRAELSGNLDAWQAMGNVSTVDWVNGEEACDECQGYEDGGPYTLDEANDLLDQTHPNCRCGLTPNLTEDESTDTN
jgi:hypothetical protein